MTGRPLIRVDDREHGDAKREYLRFWAEMAPVVTRTVVGSFDTHPMRNVTRDEVKRRSLTCKTLVDEMRQTFKWGKQRIRDTLPHALDCWLDQSPLDLGVMAKRDSW